MNSTKNKEITLPKGYLSHSQIECVLSSPNEYIKRYLYGKESIANIQQEYGKIITDILEGRKKPIKSLESALELVPRYKRTDVEIKCKLTTKTNEITLLGRLDGYGIDGTQGEYKTGMTAWTQKRANDSLQLKIYALIHYKNTGNIPKQRLTWIPTKFDGAEVVLANEKSVTFNVSQTLKDILETEVIVWRAYEKILKLVEQEYSKI